MSAAGRENGGLPPEQQAIRDKCFHPSGTFVGFKKDEIDQSISDRFEQMVSRHAGRLAVKTTTHELSYAALNEAANRVARAILSKLSIKNEPVALLLDGMPMITALFGVFKAGKIAVILDPFFPAASLNFMLGDSGAELILSEDKYSSLASDLSGKNLQLLNIEEIDSESSAENPALSVASNDLAYITYTSGSTGQPKGVVQNHLNALRGIMYPVNSYHFCAEDRMIMVDSHTDAARSTVLGALLIGACVYPWNVKEQGVAPLADWLIQQGITLYKSGSPLFHQFTDTLSGEEKFPKVRMVRLGTQAVLVRDVDLYRKHFSPDCIFTNTFASTEAGSLRINFIDRDTQFPTNIVPIGFAVDDKDLWLVDDDGNQIGFGQVGEIVVSSKYLALGYWGKPDLSREHFQPDPRGRDQRIFRTGDMGYMLPDGCLEHRGRKDFQVKIRGYRVEVAEVETALLDFPGVKEAVVLAREVGTGDQRLVAYVVADQLQQPTVNRLRSFLNMKLPDYMVPSLFMSLEALPMLPNAKVDRQALPEFGSGRPDLEVPFEAPRTPSEEILAEIWAEVLGLDEVGIHDHFLELGGDSLLASQVISRVIKTFQVDLPLRLLFEAPTVAEMGVAIGQGQVKKADHHDIQRMLSELESFPEASL